MSLTLIARSAAAFLLLQCACSADTITGTLCSDIGGSGGEVVRIAMAKCIFDLDYDRGYARKFATNSCQDIGAE